MEGPSLVIAREEFAPFLKKKIIRATGTAKIPLELIEGSNLKEIFVWGKHFVLVFPKCVLRIHFLMFGSYRIDRPRENRIPKLKLTYPGHEIYFYSCAIGELPKDWRSSYDTSIDLMSEDFDRKETAKTLTGLPEAMACDVLMDQKIFAGLGNIMKNEILYNLRLHPETRMKDLTPKRRRDLVGESVEYAWRFYHWKKANVLKRNWKIMRKKSCPECGGKVRKRATGVLMRISHYCNRCQKKK